MLQNIIVGQIGVLNMVLWGLYGDLLAEPFSTKKVLRSMSFGCVWSIILYSAYSELSLGIVVLSVIALERMTTEIYKACFRTEDQSKYKIPSDFRVRGHLVLKRAIGSVLFLLIGIYIYTILGY